MEGTELYTVFDRIRIHVLLANDLAPVIQSVRWLVSGLISPAGAGLL